MRCVCCDKVIKSLSYKKYKEKDPKTGKINIITTDIEEDYCSNCIDKSRTDYDDYDQVDVHRDLDIGMSLPNSDNNY